MHNWSELRSCVKVEVAIQGSPSLTVLMVSMDVKQCWTWTWITKQVEVVSSHHSCWRETWLSHESNIDPPPTPPTTPTTQTESILLKHNHTCTFLAKDDAKVNGSPVGVWNTDAVTQFTNAYISTQSGLPAPVVPSTVSHKNFPN